MNLFGLPASYTGMREWPDVMIQFIVAASKTALEGRQLTRSRGVMPSYIVALCELLVIGVQGSGFRV